MLFLRMVDARWREKNKTKKLLHFFFLDEQAIFLLTIYFHLNNENKKNKENVKLTQCNRYKCLKPKKSKL